MDENNEQSDAVVCSVYVAEHVWETTKPVCEWVTEHLRKGTTPREFYKICRELDRKLMDSEEVKAVDPIMDQFYDSIEQAGEGFILEDLAEFYKKAVDGKADRFIPFNNNSYIDIVAIRGRPNSRDIAVCVLSEENVVEWNDEEVAICLGEEVVKYLKGQS